MLTDATGTEAADDHCRFAGLAGSINPNIRAKGFLRARHGHLHQCFACVNYLLCKYDVAQRINQELQLHTAPTHRART
ncbi:hypothetical protein EY04_27555 [Pseudomonas chlororaphis]|nr:hypothetical protein EY04_27555 [Pseudomonas chlororaphis]